MLPVQRHRRASGAASCGADRTRCARAGTARPAARRSAGVARRTISTSADSTFGRGTNTLAGTRPTMRAVAQYATFTLTAPYAAVRGAAHRRSATSRCTITSIRSICGTPSSRSATSGVATLYGRLATSAQPRRRRAASPSRGATRRPRRCSRPVPATTSCEHADEAAVDLDRGDRRARLGERQRQRAEPGADLDDMVTGDRRRRAGRCAARCWDRRRSSARGRGAAPGRAR